MQNWNQNVCHEDKESRGGMINFINNHCIYIMIPLGKQATEVV